MRIGWQWQPVTSDGEVPPYIRHHSLCSTEKGELWAFGNNARGECGVGWIGDSPEADIFGPVEPPQLFTPTKLEFIE